MRFMTKDGFKSLGDSKFPQVGDRVKFYDGSYACYPTPAGFKTDHPARPDATESGTIIATECKLPALYGYVVGDEIPNDTIVYTDTGKVYFTRLAFLKKV